MNQRPDKCARSVLIDDDLRPCVKKFATDDRRSIAGAVNALLIEALRARGLLPNEQTHENA